MEQQTVSLKLCITELTHRQVGKNGDDFVYLDDKTKVSSKILGEATLLKENRDKELHNQRIYNEIEKLEKDLIRPLSELLDPNSDVEVKDFAENKVKEINIQKINLRNQILS